MAPDVSFSKTSDAIINKQLPVFTSPEHLEFGIFKRKQSQSGPHC